MDGTGRPERKVDTQDVVKIEDIVQSTNGVDYLDFSSLLQTVEAGDTKEDEIKQLVQASLEIPQVFDWQPHLDMPKPFATRTYLEDKPLLVSMIRFYDASIAAEKAKQAAEKAKQAAADVAADAAVAEVLAPTREAAKAAVEANQKKMRNQTIVKLLVRLGADVNATSKQGDTALFYAVGSADQDMIQFLKEKGAHVSLKDGEGKTLLHEAVASGDFTTVQAVMAWEQEGGAPAIDINAKDKAGKTALFYAVGSADQDMIQFLKEKGAHISVKDGEDKTLLHEAVASGDLPTVQTVMAWKQDDGSPAIGINAKDKAEKTALSYALDMTNRRRRTISFLLKHGADVRLLNPSDQDKLLTGLLIGTADGALLGKTYPDQLYTLLQQKIKRVVLSEKTEARRDKKLAWVDVKKAFELSGVAAEAGAGGGAGAEGASPSFIADLEPELELELEPLAKLRAAVERLKTFLGTVPEESQGSMSLFSAKGKGKTRKRALGGDVLRQNLITFLKRTAPHSAGRPRSTALKGLPLPRGGRTSSDKT